jgi:hypothetical protein
MPEGLRVRPVGRDPPIRLHVYGVIPPLAARVSKYDVPIVALGSVVVVTIKVATLSTVSVSVAETVCAVVSLSVTCTVKVEAPSAVGVPLMTPVFDIVNPAGRLPLVSFQKYGCIPPVAISVAVYGLARKASVKVVLAIANAVGVITCKVRA